MDPERLVSYLHSLESNQSPILERMAAEAARDGVPIVRRETAAFLQTMVAALKPRRILEIGTAIGYSALLMMEAAGEDTCLTTIEKDPDRILRARANFAESGMADRITLYEGDAGELLKTLDGSFDLIFLDAAKGQYIHFLPAILSLLPEGGVLISDNVLQEGDILESRFAVRRRDRTIHARMREYLWTCKHHEELLSSVLPVGDGVMVSVKKTRR